MIVLSASDIALALSDPFGLWHNHHGDRKLMDPEDEYDLFLAQQGLRVERELLTLRHSSFTDLKNLDFDSAAIQTSDLLRRRAVAEQAAPTPTINAASRPRARRPVRSSTRAACRAAATDSHHVSRSSEGRWPAAAVRAHPRQFYRRCRRCARRP